MLYMLFEWAIIIIAGYLLLRGLIWLAMFSWLCVLGVFKVLGKGIECAGEIAERINPTPRAQRALWICGAVVAGGFMLWARFGS